MNAANNKKPASNKKAELLSNPVEHIDIKSFDARPIIDQMGKMSFTSRDLARASTIFNDMLQDKSATSILTIAGSTLRPRPADYKGRLARELVAQVWPLIEDGRIKMHIHQAVEFHQVKDAHAILDENRQIGKVVLVLDPAIATTVPEPMQPF